MSNNSKKRSALKDSAALTLITSLDPDILTKKFFRDGKGKRQKVTVANLVRGTYKIVFVSTPEEFRKFLIELRRDQALTYGVTRLKKGILITVSEWNRRGRPESYSQIWCMSIL